jgi:hypothetical protein
MTGPLPARLEGGPAHNASTDVEDFDLPFVLKRPGLIRLIKPLTFNRGHDILLRDAKATVLRYTAIG